MKRKKERKNSKYTRMRENVAKICYHRFLSLTPGHPPLNPFRNFVAFIGSICVIETI